MDLIDRDALEAKIRENSMRIRFFDPSVNVILHLIRYAPAVNRWTSVEDALPEKNVRCLVYTEGGGYGISHRMGRNLEKWDCLGLQVTHWMPLPEPPEKE